MYFDAIVADRDPAHNTLQVELAAARRSVVDTAIRQVETFGARVVAVSSTRRRKPPRRASICCPRIGVPKRRAGAMAGGVPALLLALGVLTALYLPIWQKRSR